MRGCGSAGRVLLGMVRLRLQGGLQRGGCPCDCLSPLLFHSPPRQMVPSLTEPPAASVQGNGQRLPGWGVPKPGRVRSSCPGPRTHCQGFPWSPRGKGGGCVGGCGRGTRRGGAWPPPLSHLEWPPMPSVSTSPTLLVLVINKGEPCPKARHSLQSQPTSLVPTARGAGQSTYGIPVMTVPTVEWQRLREVRGPA